MSVNILGMIMLDDGHQRYIPETRHLLLFEQLCDERNGPYI